VGSRRPIGRLDLPCPCSAQHCSSVRLYDLGGRSVRTVIAAEQFPAGVHRITIDGRDERGTALASGVYFYRVETPEGASAGRFVLLK